MAHTPGPFTMDGPLLVGPAGSVAKVFDPIYAPILTAAPDLLAALKGTRDALALLMRIVQPTDGADGPIVNQWIADLGAMRIQNGFGVRADAAIAKAEGR